MLKYLKEYSSEFERDLKKLTEHFELYNFRLLGGEPLLQRDGIAQFLKMLPQSIDVSFETNGTQLPILESNVDLWTVSPKLSSSCYFENCSNIPVTLQEKHKKERINIPVLSEFVSKCTENMIFKFVVADENDVNEIKDILTKVYEYTSDISEEDIRRLVYIMPCGETEEKLQKSRLLCVETCKENGWNYTDRLQIIIYGDKRGV